MVQILLFASLAQQAGKQKLSLEISEPVTIGQIKALLEEEAGSLKGLDNCLVALNEEYVDLTDLVKPGDTLAFIPPVSGG
jgi:sulfur-carrier protein